MTAPDVELDILDDTRSTEAEESHHSLPTPRALYNRWEQQ